MEISEPDSERITLKYNNRLQNSLAVGPFHREKRTDQRPTSLCRTHDTLTLVSEEPLV